MTNILDDTYLQNLDKRLRELRREVEEELGMYSNSIYTEEKRLINDPEYCKQWIKNEVKASGDWFIREIYR